MMPRKKLIISFIFLFIILNLTTNIALADNIALNVNGERITDNLDYQIEDESILIPVNLLSDNLSVRVTWYSSIETLRFEFNDRTVKMRLDDRNMQFNDELLRMDVAPKEIDGNRYVPLKEITEALGLILNSKPEENLVDIYEVKDRLKEVNHIKTGDYEAIEIKSTEKIDHNLTYLKKPARIVFDLKGTVLDNGATPADVDSNLIKNTRIGQFNGNTTRVVLDLEDKADYILSEEEKDGYYSYLIKVNPIITEIDFLSSEWKIDSTAPLENTEISYPEDSNRVILDIYNASIEEEKEFHVAHDAINKVYLTQQESETSNAVQLEIEFKENIRINTDLQNGSLIVRMIQSELRGIAYDEDNKRVDFDLTRQVEPQRIFLSDGNRLIFDFPDTLNRVEESSFTINDSHIEEIRVSQFTDRNTRVVLDLNQTLPYESNWEDGNFMVSLLNELQEIIVTETEGQLDIEAGLLAEGNYEVNKLLGPPRLVLDIMDTTVDKGQVKIDNTSASLEDIRLSQYSTEPKQARVVFDFADDADGFEFERISAARTDNIQLKVSGLDFDQKTIVIDAGHGGIDPGGIGYSGLKEKEVVLDISLMLEELLKEEGIDVVMIRRDDSTVHLQERVELTEEADADAFISVHANAHQNQFVSGTETYTDTNPVEESKILAEYIQENLVNDLGTVDRGVKEDRIYVLENLDIPGVLIEPMFLTNQAEEELLKDEAQLEKIAFATYRAVIDYLNQIEEEEF